MNGSLPETAQVVIVGGGFAGAATAYELARAGVHDVLVCEREDTWGHHASGRNAAMGRQITEHHGFTERTVPGMAFLRDPPADFADTPLVGQNGSILLGDRHPDLTAMSERAARWRVPHEVVTVDQLVERWPLLAGVPAAGGVLFPTDGVIDVHALLVGYLRGARRRGARTFTQCSVNGFRDRGRTVLVDTQRGVVEASCVVLAAGAWVEGLGVCAGARSVHYAPIQRHLFITETVPGGDRRAPFVWHVGASEFYVRPEGSGYLISGCDEREVEPCDARPAAGAIEALAAKISPIAPRLAELGIARTWACLRTFAPDRRPVVGWDAEVPWLFWVAGLGGHGATASQAIGRAAADAIVARTNC